MIALSHWPDTHASCTAVIMSITAGSWLFRALAKKIKNKKMETGSDRKKYTDINPSVPCFKTPEEEEEEESSV